MNLTEERKECINKGKTSETNMKTLITIQTNSALFVKLLLLIYPYSLTRITSSQPLPCPLISKSTTAFSIKSERIVQLQYMITPDYLEMLSFKKCH